jgi:competence protein ComEC
MRAAAEDTLWRCDGLSCLYEAPGAPRIAHIKDERALLEDCPWADIIVMEKDVGWGLEDKACHARLVLDYGDLSRTGTQALYWSEGKLTVETVRGVQGVRPWTRPY